MFRVISIKYYQGDSFSPCRYPLRFGGCAPKTTFDRLSSCITLVAMTFVSWQIFVQEVACLSTASMRFEQKLIYTKFFDIKQKEMSASSTITISPAYRTPVSDKRYLLTLSSCSRSISLYLALSPAPPPF